MDEFPSNWASQLPIARWAWNTTRKESLGGMSPYQVVTGLVPRSPLASWLKLPSKDRVTPQAYVDELHATEQIYETVRKAQQERADSNQAKAMKGNIPSPLEVGQLVLLRRPPAAVRHDGEERTVSRKLQSKARPEVY